MRDFRPNSIPAIAADSAQAPDRDQALVRRMRVNLPPMIKPDPPNRHGPQSTEPGTSLPFDGTPESAAQIVAWAAAPNAVSATLDGTPDGGVLCFLRNRTIAGEQIVQPGQCLVRGQNRKFTVVGRGEGDIALEELRRLCAGVDPFAPSAQAAPRPSTRDT